MRVTISSAMEGHHGPTRVVGSGALSRTESIDRGVDHSSTNWVGTREVDSTSSFDAVTYFTIVGM
jgi:hypothetical protein